MRFVLCGLALLGAGAVTLRAQPPAAWVTVKGQVVLPKDVEIPLPKPLVGAQGCPPGLKDESFIVSAKTRGVKNVVVWLRPNNMNPKATFAANEINPADAKRKPETVVIDQPCCQFEPHVLVARVCDTLEVKNSAKIVHNFFWVSDQNGNANVNLAAGAKHTFQNPLAAESAPIQFRCTIHPWMNGYVRVFDHPYYAVTDDEGRFEIKNAPAGAYRIVYWHENSGFKGKAAGRFGDQVRIAGGAANTLEMKPTDFDVTK